MELRKSVLAGMMICLASVIYLIINNHIIGAVMFAFGLLTVFELKLNLLTGKAVNYHLYSLKDMFMFFIGNVIGCIIISTFTNLSVKSASISEVAYNLCLNKFSNDLRSLFCSSILCGILMGIAVKVNEKNEITNNIISKFFIIVICVAGFILIGGEHCIADISYMMLGQFITINSTIKIIIIICGNIIGSMIVKELYNNN